MPASPLKSARLSPLALTFTSMPCPAMGWAISPFAVMAAPPASTLISKGIGAVGQLGQGRQGAGELDGLIVVGAVEGHLNGAARPFRAKIELGEGQTDLLAALAVLVGHPAVLDDDLVDDRQSADAGRLVAGLRRLGRFFGGLGELLQRPVPAPLGVGLQENVWFDDDQTLDVDLAREERDDLDLDLQSVESHHLRPAAPLGIREGDLLEGHGGGQ